MSANLPQIDVTVRAPGVWVNDEVSGVTYLLVRYTKRSENAWYLGFSSYVNGQLTDIVYPYVLHVPVGSTVTIAVGLSTGLKPVTVNARARIEIHVPPYGTTTYRTPQDAYVAISNPMAGGIDIIVNGMVYPFPVTTYGYFIIAPGQEISLHNRGAGNAYIPAYEIPQDQIVPVDVVIEVREVDRLIRAISYAKFTVKDIPPLNIQLQAAQGVPVPGGGSGGGGGGVASA